MKKDLIIAPLIEPVSLEEAKLHIRVDHNEDNELISSLVTSCRMMVESHLNLALIEQTWLWSFDRWQDVAKYNSSASGNVLPFTMGANRYVNVPKGHVISVVSIATYDVNDVAEAWDISNIIMGGESRQICLKDGFAWPQPQRSILGIEIIYKAGFGATANEGGQTTSATLFSLDAANLRPTIASYFLSKLNPNSEATKNLERLASLPQKKKTSKARSKKKAAKAGK